MTSLLEIYANALREIVEALSSDGEDRTQTALEIAADALTHEVEASCE